MPWKHSNKAMHDHCRNHLLSGKKLSSLSMMMQSTGGESDPFRDNDGLAALLALELHADLLCLLTDVDGLYTGHPADPASRCKIHLASIS